MWPCREDLPCNVPQYQAYWKSIHTEPLQVQTFENEFEKIKTAMRDINALSLCVIE